MKVEFQESARPRKKSNRLLVFSMVIVAGLAIINIVAVLDNNRAQSALAAVEKSATAAELSKKKRSELYLILKSARRPEMRQALTQAVSESKPDSAMIMRAHSEWSSSDSFYVYSPDDSVTLEIQLDVWKAKRLALNKKTGTERSQRFEIPLKAGKLHLFTFGKIGDEVRLRFDGREIANVSLPKTRSGGVSWSHKDNTGLIGPPVTISNHDADFERAVESSQWRTFADVQISRSLSNPKTNSTNQASLVVGIIASLASSAPKYVSADQFLNAHHDLELEWDNKTKRYKVIRAKPKLAF